MFAYCINNPVNGYDPCGNCFHRWDFWNDCPECGGETFDQKWDHFSTWCSNSYNAAKDYITNTDPKAALDGKGITFYNGVPVIHLPFELTPFSFGVIVLGSKITSNDYGIQMLNHEYGHTLQLKKYGVVSYTCTIAIPSVICNRLDKYSMLPWDYYSSPWEFEADQLAGVTRTSYESWANDISSIYSILSVGVGVLSDMYYLCP